MWTCKKHDKSGQFGECLQCKNEKDIEFINLYWKFDNNQRNISSWHDKQDLIAHQRNTRRHSPEV